MAAYGELKCHYPGSLESSKEILCVLRQTLLKKASSFCVSLPDPDTRSQRDAEPSQFH